MTVQRPPTCLPDSPGTVYVSKMKSRGHPAVYRFSLNASLPAPWQIVSPGDGEVPSFQVSGAAVPGTAGSGMGLTTWSGEAGSVRTEQLEARDHPPAGSVAPAEGPAGASRQPDLGSSPAAICNLCLGRSFTSLSLPVVLCEAGYSRGGLWGTKHTGHGKCSSPQGTASQGRPASRVALRNRPFL